MKALLLKDFYVLRKQMWVYAIIVLAWGVVPQAWLNLLCLLYTSPSPRDILGSRMPSSA